MHTIVLIASFSSFFLLVNADVSCNIGDTEYDGYCYTFVDKRLQYPDAQAYCATEGGTLVRFRGDTDSRWISSTAATKFHETYGNFWIGLHIENKKFVWDDGHEVDYVNWAPGYPFSGYDYVGAQVSNTKWVTVQSSSALPFICYYEKGHNRLQQTTSAPAPTEKPVNVCEGADLLLGRRCYFFNPTLLPYEFAKQQCESSGKTLAVFDNTMQVQFVTATAISKFSMTYGSFWIGLDKNRNDNKFYWINGVLNTLNNWSPGYPFQNQYVVSQQVSNSKWKTSDYNSYLPSVCSGFIQ
uniref:C-type LECtin n=1 Tax=Caenorhabditis tropicalis TaxID=1561998 RepID=A0A1I7T110_9PELO